MLNEPLPIDISQAILDAVVEGIRRGNWQASRNFSPDEGSNGSTFGNDRQHFSYFWLVTELSTACPDVRAEVRSNSFCAAWGAFELRAYAGGHGLDWDVTTWDFTGTTLRRAIVDSNRKHHKTKVSVDQVQFDGMSLTDVPNPEDFTKLVVVTASELTTGKVAIYLGAPSMDTVRPCWAWVRCVYRDSEDSPGYEGSIDDETPLPRPPITPYDELAEPDFDLDVKPTSEPSEGEG